MAIFESLEWYKSKTVAPTESIARKFPISVLAIAAFALIAAGFAFTENRLAEPAGSVNETTIKEKREVGMPTKSQTSGPGPGFLEGITKETARNRRDNEINWLDWGEEAFRLAKRENKLVLLDLTAPWCHWCHVMDETTYSTPEVIEFINSNLVAVRVHADRHPEVEKAYISGGWPTTALLLPSGESLSSATYVPPDSMVDWLSEVKAAFEMHREDILGKVASHRAGYLAELEFAKSGGALPSLEAVQNTIWVSAKLNQDPEFGGWAPAENEFKPKFPQPAVIEMLLCLASGAGGENAQEILKLTLVKQKGIIDPVWGGFFRYSVDREWKTPHYEKMLSDQAGLLVNYLHYWQASGEPWASDACLDIVRYVMSWLSGPDWELWSSQDADLGSHEADGLFLPGEEYFPLGDAARRKLGTPFVERDVIANWSAKMAAALVEYGAVMGKKKYVGAGEKTLNGIWDNMRENGGWIRHSFARGTQDKPVIVDQTAYGLAALKAYYFTGKEEWLEKAVATAEVLTSLFEDKSAGGFNYRPFDPKAKGNLIFLGKPFEENCEAALFLAELAQTTGDREYANSSGQALSAAGQGYEKYGYMAAQYFLALRSLEGANHKLVIIMNEGGQPSDKELHELAGVAAPGKVIRYLSVENGRKQTELGDLHFPAAPETMVYLCTNDVCYSPVPLSSEGLGARLKKLTGGGR